MWFPLSHWYQRHRQQLCHVYFRTSSTLRTLTSEPAQVSFAALSCVYACKQIDGQEHVEVKRLGSESHLSHMLWVGTCISDGNTP